MENTELEFNGCSSSETTYVRSLPDQYRTIYVQLVNTHKTGNTDHDDDWFVSEFNKTTDLINVLDKTIEEYLTNSDNSENKFDFTLSLNGHCETICIDNPEIVDGVYWLFGHIRINTFKLFLETVFNYV